MGRVPLAHIPIVHPLTSVGGSLIRKFYISHRRCGLSYSLY